MTLTQNSSPLSGIRKSLTPIEDFRNKFESKSSKTVKDVSTFLTWDFYVKILLFGDRNVGKSCMIMRYVQNRFAEKLESTIGWEYKIKDVVLERNKAVEKQTTKSFSNNYYVLLKVQLWDMANKSAISLYPYFLMDLNGIVITYDVWSRYSFDFAVETLKEVLYLRSETMKIVLVGNKIDIIGKRKVSYEEGLIIAQEYDIYFFEISARNNYSLINLFSLFHDYENMTE